MVKESWRNCRWWERETRGGKKERERETRGGKKDREN